VKERAEALLDSSVVNALAFFPNTASTPAFQMGEGDEIRFPVTLGDENFGELRGAGSAEAIESFAGQLAALFAYPIAEDAVALDRAIDRLHRHNSHFDWSGIYRVDGAVLKLTSFRGAATPHAIISKDHGICGAAVRENQTLNIDDVTQDARYLSCDSRTRSELVVPIRDTEGQAIGEIDIDAHQLAAFTAEDEITLEELARELSALMIKLR